MTSQRLSTAVQLAELRLRDSGVRITPQRRAVIRAAIGGGKHFAAEQLWLELRRRGAKVSRATVYRTLALLRRHGILREVPLDEEQTHYELSREGDHHGHLVCLRCGRIIEFQSRSLERAIEKTCAEQGFRAASHTVRVRGLCARCAGRAGQAVGSSGRRARSRREAGQ